MKRKQFITLQTVYFRQKKLSTLFYGLLTGKVCKKSEIQNINKISMSKI